MKIITYSIVDMTEYGKMSKADVFCIHVKVLDIEGRVKKIIASISDTSWINGLDAIEGASYAARAKKTIKKLVEEVLAGTISMVTSDLGEYIVSDTAQQTLKDTCGHTLIPLAELWKEKISGNPGFDFHTETPTRFIAFGEAKYRSNINPHTIAIEQIVTFIEDEKDIMELADLKHFSSEEASGNVIQEKKAFVAAFSLNGKNYKTIFDTALTSKSIDPLLNYPEIYLVGIEI